jgi:hypothetical protein
LAKVGVLPTLALYQTLTRLVYGYCDVVGVDYKEYLLRGNETVYMSFIDWIAAMAKRKAGRKATRPIRVTGSGLASTTPYINKKLDGNVIQ